MAGGRFLFILSHRQHVRPLSYCAPHPLGNLNFGLNLVFSRSFAETSFFFTVSDLPLEDLDPLVPACERRILCSDKKSCRKVTNSNDDVTSCARQSWHSRLFVSDNLTGLRQIEVSSPGSRIVHLSPLNPLVVGSSRTFEVTVETECCYDGVELSLRDVAGNVKKCVAGVNPNVASPRQFSFLLFTIVLFLSLTNSSFCHY